MNKTYGAILIIVFIFIVFAIGYGYVDSKYYAPYKINNNIEDIQNSLEVWLNRGEEDSIIPDIIKVSKIDGTTSLIVSYSFTQANESFFGFGHLEKGRNDKLKFNVTTNGNKNSTYSYVETNKGWYIVTAGYNPDIHIDTIEVNYENGNETLVIDIPSTETYIAYHELKEGMHEVYPPRFTYYDEDRQNINDMLTRHWK
ncbi:hypothetical protein [Longirhabdus pacifica]|uniref:hypothetical protein n=1 Tax=Longirhabdus pacifica TaxID=2305227 RepID=UPI001008C211|nr:hypothetical protein [Longirhabdus pacifica]